MSLRGVLTTLVTATLALAGCGGADDDSHSAQAPAAPTPSATAAALGNHARDVVADPPRSTADEALAAAQAVFPGSVRGIALQHPPTGGLQYGIVLVDRTVAYDVHLAANSLQELAAQRVDLDDDAADDAQRELFDPKGVVDPSQAAAAAREHQPGTIVGWKIVGEESGRIRYEFRILPVGASADVTVGVDARTGKSL